MKKVICLVLGVLMLSFCGMAIAADEVQITGTVNAENQLVDESGQAFSLADNEQASELKAMVGQKVQVTGTVEEADGKKTLTVTDYEIMQ